MESKRWTVIWSVIVNLGGELNVDGAAALMAAVLGYEVTVRLTTALGPSHRRYWHATATAGTVGAAVAAGILLKLDLPRLVAAASHAIWPRTYAHTVARAQEQAAAVANELLPKIGQVSR